MKKKEEKKTRKNKKKKQEKTRKNKKTVSDKAKNSESNKIVEIEKEE